MRPGTIQIYNAILGRQNVDEVTEFEAELSDRLMRETGGVGLGGVREQDMATKHIFITGGVVSSLGKGLTSAAIGMILERRGLKVSMQKLDPYINVDPGTMSPFQHGEVYVTDDGAETDLDLGHYERFTQGSNLTRRRTSRPARSTVGHREGAARRLPGQAPSRSSPHHRRDQGGDRRGHRDDVDVRSPRSAARSATSSPCPSWRPCRQFALERPQGDVLFIHLTLLPYLRARAR